MRLLQSFVVFIFFVALLSSCKEDSISAPLTQNEIKTVYYNENCFCTLADTIIPTVWSYDIESKAKTKILDFAFIVSNIMNDEFVFLDIENQLCLFNVKSKAKTVLLSGVQSQFPEVFLSSTGKIVYWDKKNDHSSDLYIGTKSNLKEKLVVADLDIASYVGIYNNKKKLIYGTEDTNNTFKGRLTVVDIASGKIESIHSNVPWIDGLIRVYPISNLIVAVNKNPSDSTDMNKLTIMNLLNKENKIIGDNSPKFFPALSPDNSKVAYIKFLDNKLSISIINTDGEISIQDQYISRYETPFYVTQNIMWIDASHIGFAHLTDGKTIPVIIDLRTGDTTRFNEVECYRGWKI